MTVLDVQDQGEEVVRNGVVQKEEQLQRPLPEAVGEGKGRWSAKRKQEAVLRLLRGEDLETVSRSVGIPIYRLVEWRDAFLAAGLDGLKAKHQTGPSERELKEARAKVGELTMQVEIFNEFLQKKGLAHLLKRPR